MDDFSHYLKPETKSDETSKSAGLVDYVDVFGGAMAHSLVQSPVNAVAEVAEKFTGKELVKNWQFIDAPSNEVEGSGRWHLQQFGHAAGMALPCALLMKGAVGVVGKDSGLVKQTVASGLAGSVYGGLLTPTGRPVSAEELTRDRLITAGTTGASFAFIHLLSTGAFRTAHALSAGDVSLSTALKTRTGAAVISAPVGYLAAELDGKLHGRELTQAQKMSSMYTFGLMSFVAGSPKRASENAVEKTPSTVLELSENGGARLRAAERAGFTGLRAATGRMIGEVLPVRDLTGPKLDFLSTPPKSLVEVSKRLSAPIVDEIKVNVPKFENAVDAKFTVETQRRPARTYRADNGVSITVPEEYAQILDKVREYRKAVEATPSGDKAQLARDILGADAKYADRALPEDFLDALDRLPDRGLVKRLVLMNEANADDAVLRRLLKDDRYYSAAVASLDGEVTFFQRYVDGEIGLHAGHEWSHLLRYSLEGNTNRSVRALPELFDTAAAAERKGASGLDARTAQPEEIWAKFAEEVLSGAGPGYQRLLAESPAQAAIMGRALSESLAAAEASGRQGLLHDFWKQRALEMQRQLPRALHDMVRVASEGNAQSASAARFVAYTGLKTDLQTITGQSKLDLSGPFTTDDVLAKLPGVTWITELNLSGAFVSENGMRHVAQLPLRSLDVSQTMFGDRGAQHLARSTGLQELNAAGTTLTEHGLSELRRIRTLNTLNLQNTYAAGSPANLLRGLTVTK